MASAAPLPVGPPLVPAPKSAPEHMSPLRREGRGSLSWLEPFRVSRKVGSPLGRKAQWRPHPLHITQQQGFACMVVPASSMSILGCRAPHSRHLRLAPGSQQQSSLSVCFPNPKFQQPAPVRTSGRISGWGAEGCGWTVCAGLSVLPAACCVLPEFLKPPFCPADLPASEGASPYAGTFSPSAPPSGV